MSRYVIVGCGAAGNSAAETIRKLEPDAEIRMFTREGAYYYYRPALPEYLAGEKTLKGFTLHDGAWYEKNRIDVHLSTEIVDIRPGEGPWRLRREDLRLRSATPGDGQSRRRPEHQGNDLEGVSSPCTPLPMPMP